jgi:hypothetical protein
MWRARKDRGASPPGSGRIPTRRRIVISEGCGRAASEGRLVVEGAQVRLLRNPNLRMPRSRDGDRWSRCRGGNVRACGNAPRRRIRCAAPGARGGTGRLLLHRHSAAVLSVAAATGGQLRGRVWSVERWQNQRQSEPSRQRGDRSPSRPCPTEAHGATFTLPIQ